MLASETRGAAEPAMIAGIQANQPPLSNAQSVTRLRQSSPASMTPPNEIAVV